jgi:RNA polymerase sigma factor (TIGR02999 family)
MPGMPCEDAHPPADVARLNASAVEPQIRHIATVLLPIFYDELKHIAHRARSRLGGSHTLQTTALVHEAFLRLGPSRGFANETHFLRAAALAMRHALINYAEARVAEKRGGGGIHLTLSHASDFAVQSDEGLLTLNAAVEQLAIQEPRLADVVECRFFAGYSEEDTARVLGMSLRTVQRDWFKARTWLYREIAGASPSEPSSGRTP